MIRMPSKRAAGSRKAPKPARRAPAPTPKARAKGSSTTAARARVANTRSVSAGRTPRSAVRPTAGAATTVKARPLTKREMDEFRRLLEVERQRLSDELEAIEEHLPEVENISVDASGGYDEDLADVASDTFEREKGMAIENSVNELLQQVEEALGRLEDGSFGICEICEQPIHPDRLRALPYARLCINCKAREEQTIPR
jgi:RNA polymerase-binding protein DksA